MTTRILVVDGYAPSRHNLALFVGSLDPDYVVVAEAETDDMAMVHARALHPDIALVDIDLPDRSGIATARALRQGPLAPAVIVITDHPSAEYREAAFAAGATECIAKTDLVGTLPAILAAAARRTGERSSTFDPPGLMPSSP